MKSTEQVVNSILGSRAFRSGIKIYIIKSIVINESGRFVLFNDGQEYDANEWSDYAFEAFAPGGCLLIAPDGEETICSPFFVEHFVAP